MICQNQKICGGCVHRSLEDDEYRRLKIDNLTKLLNTLSQSQIPMGEPVFIGDGVRRRATFAFKYQKGKIVLGFNRFRSNEVINIDTCPLLLSTINSLLPDLSALLTELCSVRSVQNSKKNKKTVDTAATITQGDVHVCAVSNGLDVVLEFDAEPNLEHKMIIFEWVQKVDSVIRISHRRNAFEHSETLIEKIKPQIVIGNCNVYIPAGTFLQASSNGEKALVDLVLKYLGDTKGKIADLFCGVGTFTYPLSITKDNKIISIDSSHELLSGFRQSVNANMLNNVEIVERNLFKYPLVGKELCGFSAIIFDPPRAGAEAQVKAIAALKDEDLPAKIISVSCNPHSFIKDAEVLLNAGYEIAEITLVDQFAYSNHSELVALFTLKK